MQKDKPANGKYRFLFWQGWWKTMRNCFQSDPEGHITITVTCIEALYVHLPNLNTSMFM